MMPLASGSSIFKQSGAESSVLRLPAHVAPDSYYFLQALGFPMALLFAKRLGLLLFYSGGAILVYFCHDRKGRPSVLP